MSAPATPSVDDLLRIIGLARTVIDHLPPAAITLPDEATHAMRQFYDLSKYHGVAPTSAPHIPNDGKI